MKIHSVLIVILVASLLVTAAGAADTSGSSGSSSVSGSVTTLSGEQALGQVYVSSVTLDPETFYPYEEGTITVQITNSGTQSVVLQRADLIDNNIILKNSQTYNNAIYLGPKNSMTYTFHVMAKPPEGTYFPLFTVASRDSGSVRYPVKVDVDSTDIVAAVSDRPDNFALSTKDRVNISIINPRSGSIGNVIIRPQGTGFDFSPAQKFISSVPAGGSVQVPFFITPHAPSNVTFHISYMNGVYNEHTRDVVVPLVLSENKLAADPILNNIEVTATGSSFRLTGDVNNAGITDAKALVLTTGAPAVPVDPYPEYAIGSLASDDFSSFELTFITSDLSSVPVIVTWKDADGNVFSSTKTLNLGHTLDAGSTGTGSASSVTSGRNTGSTSYRSAGGPPGGGSILGFGGTRGNGISAFYPVIIGAVIVIAGIVLYTKRKWVLGKLKKQ